MPKDYEVCPKCSKKGLYLSNGYPYWGDGTKRCRYCGHTLMDKTIAAILNQSVPTKPKEE